METPSKFLMKLSHRVFTDSADREKFIDALLHPIAFHPSIIWCQDKPINLPFITEPHLFWQPVFVDRLALGSKPGQHPLHNTGHFYCLDFSSVFAISTILTVTTPVNLIVDMCAAPGGKSIFAYIALQPEVLISNETIAKRSGMLISNLKRCHIHPVGVITRDSKILAEILPKTANLVIVDAPCSGQSLLAKGGKAEGCFHPININKNANRQKRILANSAQIVAPSGYLAYMTCTYSPEENEQVSEWFLSKFPQFQPVKIPHLTAYQSHLSTIPCYRMWPQSGLGAGAFTILFQNTDTIPDNIITGDRISLDFLNSSHFVFKSPKSN